MLVQFSVGNFRSFKEIVSLNMTASALTEHKDFTFNAIDNVNLLKSGVIYGANGSGKSNLLKAMSFMKAFVINSSKETQAKEPINVDRFLLSRETENKPAYFEIVYIENNVRYRYGFEVDNTRVHSEWLFTSKKLAEKKLYTRNENTYVISDKFSEGKGLEKRTRENALFLSVVAQFNGKVAQVILDWFERLNVIETVTDKSSAPYTMKIIENISFKKYLLELLRMADLGIEDISKETQIVSYQDLPPNIPEEIKRAVFINAKKIEKIDILTKHKKFNKNKFESYVNLDMEQNESGGTNKVFALSGPLFDTLQNGKILIIDELDARLHPLITEALVRLFASKKTNKSNAQLIFCTHNINLLNNRIFRRDQIWFTEKDRYGSSKLFSLAEYKVRKDASFDKDYMKGKYGAIPFIGDISEIFKSNA